MKNSSDEDNWFKKHEKAMLEEAANKRKQELLKARQAVDRQQLESKRLAHWLKCPKCGHDMAQVIYEGIEIEECEFCKGVYFDRAELDALLLRKTQARFSIFREMFHRSDS